MTKENFKPGSFGCHEALDRTSIICGMVDDYLCGHPSIKENADWFRLAEVAHYSLAELYQKIGAAHAQEPTQ